MPWTDGEIESIIAELRGSRQLGGHAPTAEQLRALLTHAGDGRAARVSLRVGFQALVRPHTVHSLIRE